MQTVPVQPDERRLNRRKETVRRATSPSNSLESRTRKKKHNLSSGLPKRVQRPDEKTTDPRKSIDTRFPFYSLIDSGIL